MMSDSIYYVKLIMLAIFLSRLETAGKHSRQLSHLIFLQRRIILLFIEWVLLHQLVLLIQNPHDYYPFQILH